MLRISDFWSTSLSCGPASPDRSHRPSVSRRAICVAAAPIRSVPMEDSKRNAGKRQKENDRETIRATASDWCCWWWPWRALVQAASAQQTLTYADLVNRMTDLERLAVLPDRARRASSGPATTGPASTTRRPASTSHWDANGDGDGIIRKEGEQVVMAEMEGPGLHLADLVGPAEKGHVKIYLDGQRAAGRRPAVRRLLRRQARPVQLPACSPTTWKTSGCSRAEPLLADPLPEVVQDRGRQGLGQLLPVHLHDVPQGDAGADVQRRRWRPRTPRP